jgi:hypothetical protein
MLCSELNLIVQSVDYDQMQNENKKLLRSSSDGD